MKRGNISPLFSLWEKFMTDKKKILLTAVITAVVTCAVTLAVKTGIDFVGKYTDNDQIYLRKLETVEKLLDNSYLYDYDKDELWENAIKAYVEALGEPYTHYYTPAEFSSYISNIQDGYVGIGVVVGVNDSNQIEVVSPYEGGPAYEAGVLPGDIITAVNGTEYSGDKMEEAINIIRNGKKGETVDLTLLRDGEEILLTVERRDITTDSVYGEMIDDGIGYIRITGFDMASEDGGQSTSTEFKEKLKTLKDSGMQKLIIDLRDNPGGLLTEVCDIADELLPEGVITYTENKQGNKKYYNSENGGEAEDIPIVVLINGNSASASEVLTGALRDRDRAVVVGSRSYGKGIVQDVRTFIDGAGISFTSAKYYTPSGVCIHGEGIEPDVTVELGEEYEGVYASMLSRDEDTQLQKALEIIKQQNN